MRTRYPRPIGANFDVPNSSGDCGVNNYTMRLGLGALVDGYTA